MACFCCLNSLIKILPIMYSLIGFGFLIAIHECGHFVFCKIFNIHTPTFSIGFGPELFRKKIGDTNFRLAIIPLGGYVEIAGLAELGQGEQEFAQDAGERSFQNKPYWQKALVLCGGVLFNLLFAYFAFTCLFLIGSPTPKPGILIAATVKDTPAEKYGLKAGDVIVGINDLEFSQDPVEIFFFHLKELQTEIKKFPNQEVSLHIIRDNKPVDMKITLSAKKDGEKLVGSIGAYFEASIPQLPFFSAIQAGFSHTNTYISNLVAGIKQLFVSRSLDGAMGPIMMISHGATLAKESFLSLFIFLALISISLALMNILPIGALDGGQLLMVSIEAAIRRSIPDWIKIALNLATWVLFIGLFLYLTYREVGMLFGDKIRALTQCVITWFK